eukprot:TRINITY_DN63032_c0_g1_i1.p1 TRINITY_DN63032_c0_g1~~TRINITY_DN63032_c0_g1_i1.p1  ORF type:complete len:1234 (+),score=167.62 TRINITY_DN63032_c0_g1_i1:168-3869(+)
MNSHFMPSGSPPPEEAALPVYSESDQYYYDGTAEHVPTHGWYEHSCTQVGHPNSHTDPVRALACDPRKELIWVATASGMLHAHHAPDMARIVSTYIGEPSSDPSNHGDVRDIVVSDTSVLAAVSYGLAVVKRGGVLSASVRADTIKNAKALALNPMSDNHVCIGGESRMLAVIDLQQQRILRQATLRGATGVTAAVWAAPQGASSLAVFSTSTGRISLCDPSTMREVNAIAAFAGATTSIATSGYYLAATGLGTRGGLPYLEQTVKLYDIRAVQNPLPSVLFSAPPMFIAFDHATSQLYNTDGALWMLSPHGVMQLLDISTVTNREPAYPLCDEIHLDAGSDVFTAMVVSSQGLLVLGDSGGFVHQWSSSEAVKVNSSSEPVWTTPINPEPPTPSIHMDDFMDIDIGATIPKVAMQEFECEYLTEELFNSFPSESLRRKRGELHATRISKGVDTTCDLYLREPFASFPLQIADEILDVAQQHTFVSYAQAPPSFVRNSESGHKRQPKVRTANGKYRLQGERRSSSPTGAPNGHVNTIDLSKPTERSKYVEMDLVAWESIEGFDFLQYNTSPRFCGLENALPNVYVNPAVQALYFCPPVRTAIGNHSCHRDWCISCELSFLFHMFDLGGAGMACEAGNFTRAFMTMANAGALGLLDGPHALPLSQRIENFTRYLLEQLHKDEGVETESTVMSVFGAETRSHGTFIASKTDWERVARPFQHSLIYNLPRNTPFCNLLEHSLHHKGDTTRAFCESSGQFESMTQHRELRSLPNVLLLGCNTKTSGYSEWWFDENESPYPLRSPSSSSHNLDKIASKAMQDEKKIVESMRIEITDGISVTQIESLASGSSTSFGYDAMHGSFGDTGNLMAEYDLSFVIAEVPPTSRDVDAMNENDGNSARNVAGHLVAYIHVPHVYSKTKDGDRERSDQPKVNEKHVGDEWWCFNDFVIAPCEGFDEVAAFHKFWKKPCVIGYVRRDINSRVKMEINDAAVDVREVIGEENHNAAIGLQPDEEVPGKGTVLALDCEFVMVSRDEADIFGDGTWQIVVPARMALARVSVIRGYGRLKGVALIDDYVAVREPVVDYLTRFSGLSEGDLDATRSPHKVSSLKTVYKRLRCLVDAGCIFVGHGLKSDFRIINFVVPPEQVIDTVTLFRVKNKRLLGLRFLSNALLGGDIQSETHDSIEDSDAALRLYDVYLKLKDGEGGKDRFQRTLKELYAYGYAHGWKADPSEPFAIPP